MKEETKAWEPVKDEQILGIVSRSAQQSHQNEGRSAPTESADEEDRPIITWSEARRDFDTAIAYFEQEEHAECALQVAVVVRFLDTTVGLKARVQTHSSAFFLSFFPE